jgi:glycosyltransferase involved in cell wall biosynthesis/Flp pilus assembly protein TadD
MEQLSAKHGKICLVFDRDTFPDGVDRLSSDIKKLFGSGSIEIVHLAPPEYSGVLMFKGISAQFVDTWEALAEFVAAKNIKTLHIKAHGHWSTISSATVFCRWQKQPEIKVIVEASDARWNIDTLKQCSAVVVYTHEARLRLLGCGLEPDQVLVRPRSLEFPRHLPRTQRLMLRKAFGIPEVPLLFSRTVTPELATALKERWHIITPDVQAPQWENITCFNASKAEVERSFLRAADALLCYGDSTPLWYLKEANDWSIEVFTTDSFGIEDLRPMVVSSLDLTDLILQLNGYASVVLTDGQLGRDHWFSMQSTAESSLPVTELYQRLWNNPAKISHTDSVASRLVSRMPKRILMQNRPNAEECPGGDTVVMHRFAEILRRNGVQVDIEHSENVDYSQYDLVHLFNFALPEVLEGYARKVFAQGKPFVVTALDEDMPEFYLQGVEFARQLLEYVKQGQQAFAWDQGYRLAAGRAPRFKNDWVAAHADRVICCGARERSSILRDYPFAKIAEVKFAIDQNLKGNNNTMTKVYGIKDYVLCVGRLEFRKNQLGLLKALEHTDHTLVFATGGFSYSPEYDEACRKYKRKGRTIFLERLSAQDLADVYQGARVHALPSWYELPGLVSLEAALHGCEIVVTDRGTIRDYVGEMAHYCEADTTDSIRNAVEQAYRIPKGTGLGKMLEGLTWESSTQALIVVYQEVLEARDNERGLGATEFAKFQPVQFQSTVLKEVRFPGPVTPNPVLQYDIKEYEILLDVGETAGKNRDFVKAECELLRAIKLSGGTLRAHRALGAVYFAQQKNQEALGEFEKAVKSGGEDGRTLCGYAMSLLAVGRVGEAHNHLLRSAQLEPYEMITMFHIIQTSYRLNKVGDLIGVLTKYCAHKVDDLDMRYCLAGALYQNGDHTRAKQENEEVLRRKSDHEGACELQGKLDERFNLQRETTKVVEVNVPTRKDDLLSVSRQYAVTFDGTDMKLSELEDLKRRREFDKVKEGVILLLKNSQLRPDQVVCAELFRAEAVLLSGQVDEGTRVIKELFDRNGNDPRVLCSYAATLCFNGEWDQAALLFQRALDNNPRSDVALAGLGGCLQQRGETEKAWYSYKEALLINVECRRALLGLIQIGHERKRFDELESFLKAYLELHPADLDFLYAMAGCLFAQEKYEEARDKLNIIGIFDGKNERMIELLKIIEERVGGSGSSEFIYQQPGSQVPVM